MTDNIEEIDDNDDADNGEPVLGNAYIPHPMAEEAKGEIQVLFNSKPLEDHAFCGLLIGPTGSGKSAVVRRFRKEQEERDKAAGITGRSVIYVRLPNRCKTKDLFQELLKELEDPMAYRRDSYADMTGTAVRLLTRNKTRLVIFDEAQRAVPRKGLKIDAYEVANFFIAIGDKGRANILFAGLDSARRLMENSQLESRGLVEATTSAFDWWVPHQQEEFCNILADFQDMMEIPFMKLDPRDDTKLIPDDLSDEDLAWRLSFGSKGLLRVVVAFLVSLQSRAQVDKRTYIDRDMFAKAWDKMPAKVRKTANANPFWRDRPTYQWKPAGHTEGERATDQRS
jgi:hypothetical protein